MKTCFHSHFYTDFHASVILLFLFRIFSKFSPKCITKKLGMIYTILGSFCSFLNWEEGRYFALNQASENPCVKIANREDHDQTVKKQSDLRLDCLSIPVR